MPRIYDSRCELPRPGTRWMYADAYEPAPTEVMRDRDTATYLYTDVHGYVWRLTPTYLFFPHTPIMISIERKP